MRTGNHFNEIAATHIIGMGRPLKVQSRSQQVHLVIPSGTKVLTRDNRGVGVVTYTPSSPEHAYRVRFPYGEEASFRRSDLTIYRHEQEAIPLNTEASTFFDMSVTGVSLVPLPMGSEVKHQT